MTQDNATIVRRFAEEVITRGDIDSAVQFVWEDVVERVPLPGQGHGLEGLKDILLAMRAAFRGPRRTRGRSSVSRQRAVLSVSGGSSSIAWRKAASRTRASSWTPLA